MYVLDEPSIGLHQRDNARLIETLKHLRDLGNSVVVVEHDEEAIRAADYVVDMGPGAGRAGGEIVAEGTPAQIIASPDSLTGKYLSHALSITVPRLRNRPGAKRLTVREASGNNLKKATLELAGGPVRLRHRRLGLGQVHADQRHHVRRGRAPPLRFAGRTRAARFDLGPGAFRQGGERRPEPDRAHAALQSRDLHGPVHADPRALRRRARGARARLRRGAFLVQRQGRALRSLPGRRRHQGGDAFPAPTSMSPATSATASATTARRSRSGTRGAASTKCCR